MAEVVRRGLRKIAITTKWYQFHATNKCGFLCMPWNTDKYTYVLQQAIIDNDYYCNNSHCFWYISIRPFPVPSNNYRQTSYISHALVGNKTVDHSDVVGASPVGAAPTTVYPKKYAHGFVVLCFVVVLQSFIMNSHEVFIHIHQSCFPGTGAVVRLPQCQLSKPDGYGKISQCITTTKHSKAKTVCKFLGIYCTSSFSP